MLKKLFFLFTLMLISLNVNAQNLGTPLSSVDYVDSTSQQGNASIGTWWDTEYYVAPFRLGYFTSATAEAEKIAFYWGGANLCTGQNLKISGQIGGLWNFFRDNPYSIIFINNNQNMTCSFEYQDPSRIGFTCVGVGGGDLYVAINQHSFITRENYEIGIRRNFDLSCEVTNLQVMQQDIINTQNIINNQTNNTNSIIGAVGGSTTNIINNLNENTDKEINSQKVCSFIDKNKISENNKRLFSNGSSQTHNGFGVTDYISISSYSEIKVLENVSSSNLDLTRLCFYNINKESISCLSMSQITLNQNLTIPSGSSYVRFTINVTENKPQYELCNNGNQALNDNINDLNDNITSEEAPDTTDALNSFNDSLASDAPITDLLTLPLTLINAYNQGINATCSPYNLGNLYGTNIVFPCIDLEQRLGHNLWYTIDSLCSIFLIYSIAMLFVHAFDSLTSLKDDFDGMYVPKHAGKHVGSGVDG